VQHIDGQDQVKGAELVIRQLPNGQIQVSGPIQDKLLCYGMLECAKDAIRAFEPAAASKIVRAASLPNGPRPLA